jgi:hypothetical protein
VFFASTEKLTDDSNASIEDFPATEGGSRSGRDLYRYDVNSKELTDLTAGAQPGYIVGAVGVSEDGQYVYFVARGSLTAGAPAGKANVYVWHNGQPIRFVAALSATNNVEELNWTTVDIVPKSSRVAPDGHTALISSSLRLTSYDNAGHSELYRYDAATDQLSCVSCNQRVAKATGDSGLSVAQVPVGLPIGPVVSHALSDDGQRVFFESEEALIPPDTNGKVDVYEWHDGEINLVSSGQSPYDTAFSDASADGKDVFIVTRDQLVPGDTDQNADLYDARIEGGFPNAARSVPPCEAEECRAARPTPELFAAPTSASFNGAGNLSPPPQVTAPKHKMTGAQIRARNLSRALKACRRKHRAARKRCEARARRLYGLKSKTNKSNRRTK